MALVTDLLNWLQGLPEPGVVAAASGLVFAECTLGLGFLVPGESALLVAATTATSASRFLTLWAAVTVCAALGDSVGYALGRRFGPRLRKTKLIRKYGLDAWAVFFARFLPVLRTLTPAAAGASGLPFRKFLPATTMGALCWSAVHVGLGATLGEAAKRVEGALSTGFLIAAAVVVGALVVLLARVKKRKARESAVPARTTE